MTTSCPRMKGSVPGFSHLLTPTDARQRKRIIWTKEITKENEPLRLSPTIRKMGDGDVRSRHARPSLIALLYARPLPLPDLFPV